MRLGIDFGTTRTVVAALDRGNQPVVGFEAADGTVVDHWPTLLATSGKRRVFGWDAAAKLGVRGWSFHRSLKRLLASAGPADEVRLGKESLPLRDLMVAFLEALRRDVLERSNLPVRPAPGEPIEAMIAVPAGASSAQRFLTMDAFRAAGFEVAGLLNEPSAAGVEYAHRYRKTLTATREDVLVYDLGGGTFDVSLVRMGGGAHEVLAHAGDNHLGGDDFDALLLDLALAKAGRSIADEDRPALLEAARAAKERLTPTTKKIPLDLDDETTVTVAAADFYAAAAPLVERSLEVVRRVVPDLTDDAQDTLAGVYVTGGASDLPVVARTLKEVFGKRVKRSAYASASTAVGLALAFEEPALRERFSRTFGVFREREAGADVVFDPILTPELAVGPGADPLVRRYRAVHNVGCYRYAECARLDDGGLPVGDLLPWGVIRFPFDPALHDADALDTVPVARLAGAGPLVEERYAVTPAGIVEVRITDLESGFSRAHVLGAARPADPPAA